MVTPQEAYDSVSGTLDGMVFTGFCKDYLGCWVFPYLPEDGNGLGGVCFVAKDTGNHVLLHPLFKMTDFIKAPDVSDQVDFDTLEHSCLEAAKADGKKRIEAMLAF